MYEDVAGLPQSHLISSLTPHMMRDPETRVLSMESMSLAGGELELSVDSLVPGHQVIVCAELRLGDINLQTECFIIDSLDQADDGRWQIFLFLQHQNII